ncbi:MAG: RNA polymerase sigma factor [Fimbriimonas sp.]
MGRTGWEPNEEARLVDAAQAGDLKAFDALARHYRPALVLLAAGILRTREQAEDAAQDALLAAYSALPKLEDPERFGAWLGTIVRHRARRLAQGQRRPETPLDAILLSYSPALAERAVEAETGRVVRCAMARLPPEVQPVVELYYLDDWSVHEISDFLGLPQTTVKWRLHDGRRRMRAMLPDYEETYEREPL